MFDIKFSMFFDRAGVMKHVKDGTRSVLAKAGAFVRRRAKGSIRPGPKKRKYVPVPNKPPRSWTNRLKDLIFFAYDQASESVVIGPLLFRQKTPTIPQVLEEGGVAVSNRGESKTYRKFPYMEPALKAEAPKFPELFTDSIK